MRRSNIELVFVPDFNPDVVPDVDRNVDAQRSRRAAPILGIDPGLSRCGYGAVTGTSAHPVACAAGVIRTAPDLELAVRLAQLQMEIEALLDELAPQAVAVERVLFQANVRTAMSVGQASGLVLAAAARRSILVAQYSPNEMKLSVTGDGAADKAQVQRMVAHQLRLAQLPEPPDAADALGLALCHLSSAPLRAAVAAGADDPSGPGRSGSGSSRLDAAIAAAADRDRRASSRSAARSDRSVLR